MSLNRRLYQWLLNRVGDSAVTGLPVAGVDEQLDTTFFMYYTAITFFHVYKDNLSIYNLFLFFFHVYKSLLVKFQNLILEAGKLCQNCIKYSNLI